MTPSCEDVGFFRVGDRTCGVGVALKLMHDACADHASGFSIRSRNHGGDRCRGQMFKGELIEPGQLNVEAS